MSEFFKVAKEGAVPEGEGRAFAVEGRMVGVYLLDGEYFAMNDFCPHMGASLASGYVEDHAVSCPWHAWRFSVKDGTWLDNPKIKTDCYPVRVEAGMIEVQIPEKKELPSDESQSDESPSCGGTCNE
jgi:nitrite reductase (NADH) small subunit